MGGDLGRAARRRLECLIVLRDSLVLGGVDGPLLAMKDLLLGVIGLALLVQRHLRLQVGEDLRYGQL
jgi:hypothetical protein